MTRLKEIDPSLFEMSNYLGCSESRARSLAEQERKPERILPYADSLCIKFYSHRSLIVRLAICQQATVDAICRWLEEYAHARCWTKGVARDIITHLRADAQRVVDEAKGE